MAGEPKAKNKGGRPKIQIDKAEFEKLCGLQCTKDEVCGWFNITDKTLDRWTEETYQKSFSDIFRLKRGIGFISLRRSQFELAKKNPAMCIWLGKQYLGQREPDNIMLQERETIPEFDKMTDAELDKYIKENK